MRLSHLDAFLTSLSPSVLNPPQSAHKAAEELSPGQISHQLSPDFSSLTPICLLQDQVWNSHLYFYSVWPSHSLCSPARSLRSNSAHLLTNSCRSINQLQLNVPNLLYALYLTPLFLLEELKRGESPENIFFSNYIYVHFLSFRFHFLLCRVNSCEEKEILWHMIWLFFFFFSLHHEFQSLVKSHLRH